MNESVVEETLQTPSFSNVTVEVLSVQAGGWDFPQKWWFRKGIYPKIFLNSDLSKSQNLGWMFDVGEEMLPIDVGLVKIYCKDPYMNQTGFHGMSLP